MTQAFWNKEYKDPNHLTMSDEPSSDLLEFVVWTKRNAEWPAFPKHGTIVDIGCGNGRNLVPLCYEFNMNGYGTDISEVAVNLAKQAKAKGLKQAEEEGMKINPGLKIEFEKAPATAKLPFEDASVDVVLDMMVSHQLVKAERHALAAEIARVLKPYGWLFFKTFYLEGDMNAARMIKEHPITLDAIKKNPEYADSGAGLDKSGNPIPEENSYIHPHTKGLEHVYTEEEIDELFMPYFKVIKVKKSHKHIKNGKPYKRRTISVYLERKRD